MDEETTRALSGGLVGTATPPGANGGQAAPSAVSDGGGAAAADAGTGGQQKYGYLAVADRDALRMTLAAAHPDAIPELIRGETVGEMVGSLAEAKAVYARTVEATRNALPVSAGGGGRPVAVDVNKLTPIGKISYGLRNG